MTPGHKVEMTRSLMEDYALRTEIEGVGSSPHRYLWTDAFAVCNFIGIFSATREQGALDSARGLVDRVHGTLGRYRDGDAREGWISGLPEQEGWERPTCGGLRIGKPLNERAANEPPDEQLEWERDGQYFHYLTKWVHALGQLERASGDERYLRAALELAIVAYERFVWVVPSLGVRRLYWKMSIDLSRPLVSKMGQHDPLDGLLTLQGLRAQALRNGLTEEAAPLETPIGELQEMCHGMDWTTADPLGLGGLLLDAYRLTAVAIEEGSCPCALLDSILNTCVNGLLVLIRGGTLNGHPSQRLAFRELGLAIGLHAFEHLADRMLHHPLLREKRDELTGLIEILNEFVPLAGSLEGFWSSPSSQAVASWQEHLDINAVMLATSLVPDGFLGSDTIPGHLRPVFDELGLGS